MAWRKAWIPERTRLLPLLAIAVDSGNLRRGLETLSEDHPNAKIRNRFLWTLQRIDQGDATVAAMRKGGLLSKREASSLALTSSRSTQAWLLRWFAARRQSNNQLEELSLLPLADLQSRLTDLKPSDRCKQTLVAPTLNGALIDDSLGRRLVRL